MKLIPELVMVVEAVWGEASALEKLGRRLFESKDSACWMGAHDGEAVAGKLSQMLESVGRQCRKVELKREAEVAKNIEETEEKLGAMEQVKGEEQVKSALETGCSYKATGQVAISQVYFSC